VLRRALTAGLGYTAKNWDPSMTFLWLRTAFFLVNPGCPIGHGGLHRTRLKTSNHQLPIPPVRLLARPRLYMPMSAPINGQVSQ
jgi:hypothetical protein